MRFIPTRWHAAMDYAGGIVLIGFAMLWMNEADFPSAAALTPLIVGIVILLQSLFTDYEYSLVNAIPVPLHLGMDAVGGIVLAASPWLFGFAESVWVPHLLLGLMELGAAFCTETHRRSSATPPRKPIAST